MTLAAEAVTMQTVTELISTVRIIRPLKSFATSLLILLQIFQLGMALYDLVFNYGLMMRCGADIPLGYYVIKPPVLFDNTLPNEGQVYGSTIAMGFLKHSIEAQLTQSIFLFSWMGIVTLMYLVRLLIVISQKCRTV